LVSLDPFSVFASAKKVAGLDFYDRGQIGRADGPGAKKPNTTAAVLRFTMFAFSGAAVFCLELFARVLITLPTNNSAKCLRR